MRNYHKRMPERSACRVGADDEAACRRHGMLQRGFKNSRKCSCPARRESEDLIQKSEQSQRKRQSVYIKIPGRCMHLPGIFCVLIFRIPGNVNFSGGTEAAPADIPGSFPPELKVFFCNPGSGS